ncbi:MAG: LytTR family DNA-binding domain-containing protein [Salinimicrobium sp.]
MKAVIVEDEKPSARRLYRMLEKLDVEVLCVLHSVEDAAEWFGNNEHPGLIFLDIQLSDGLSFEIFEKVEIKSPIIFTTAYDEYALKAFKLNSVDYLLKPIDEEELQNALKKFRENRSHSGGIDLTSLKALLTTPSTEYKKRFSIQVGQHLKIINTEDISCFCSENKATYVHTLEKRNYLMETSLDKLEDELDPKDFFRVNRQFIIRLCDIADIISYSNQRLEVKLQHYREAQIIVSRERVKAFKEWLE